MLRQRKNMERWDEWSLNRLEPKTSSAEEEKADKRMKEETKKDEQEEKRNG